MEEEVCPPLAPQGLTLQRGHHSFAQSQHQAKRGAKEEEAGDLEVKAGGTGGTVGSLRGGSGWAGGCARPPGLPGGGGWGGCLQAACGGGCQRCHLRSPAQAQFGVDGVGMSPVLRALGLGTSHVAGGALGGQGRGFWAGPAQPLSPLCQGIPHWACLRGEQLIVLEEAGDRNILRTGDNRFLLIWK